MTDQHWAPTYKYCFVPMCTNTSFKTPEKLFLSVPKKEKDRKKWLKAARRTAGMSSTMYCCEDHFDIENDIENYMYVKLFQSRSRVQIKLKPGIIPTKFNCQTSRLVTGRSSHISVQPKLERKRIVKELLEQSESQPAPGEQNQNELPKNFELTGTNQEIDEFEHATNEDDLTVEKFIDKGVQVQLFDSKKLRNVYICSDHFTIESYMSEEKIRLNPSAIPVPFTAPLRKTKSSIVMESDEPLKLTPIKRTYENIKKNGSTLENISDEYTSGSIEDDADPLALDSDKIIEVDKKALIGLVQEYEILYDGKHNHYKFHKMIDENWKLIGQKLQVPGKDCKKVWCLLRESFRRYLINKNSGIVKKPKWKYEDEMSFVVPYMITNTSNCAQTDESLSNIDWENTDDKNGANDENIDEMDIEEEKLQIVSNADIKIEPCFSLDSTNVPEVKIEPGLDSNNIMDETELLFYNFAQIVKKLSPYYHNMAKTKVAALLSKIELSNSTDPK